MPALQNEDLAAAGSALEGDAAGVAYRVAERVTPEVVRRMTQAGSKPSIAMRDLLMDLTQDTARFIFETHKKRGRVTQGEVLAYVASKHRIFFGGIGFDHAACGVAMAELMLVISTQGPAAAAQLHAAVVAGGIGLAVGGMGVMYGVGTGALAALSVGSIYLTASQTAQVCESSISALADAHGRSRLMPVPKPASYLALRCELPIKQYPN